MFIHVDRSMPLICLFFFATTLPFFIKRACPSFVSRVLSCTILCTWAQSDSCTLWPNQDQWTWYWASVCPWATELCSTTGVVHLGKTLCIRRCSHRGADRWSRGCWGVTEWGGWSMPDWGRRTLRRWSARGRGAILACGLICQGPTHAQAC